MKNIRASVFWTLDKLKGSPIKKHYDDIKEIMENPKIRDKRQKEMLNNLLNVAVNNTKFYSKYKGFQNLQDFPVINKSIIKENIDDFINKTYEQNSLHYMSTSGSTGTPFKSAQNKEKRQRNIADLIYFNEMGHCYLGDKFIFYRVWSDAVKISKLAAVKQNEIMGDITNSSEEKLKELVKQFERSKPDYLLGYGSAYQVLADYLETINYQNSVKLKGIISSADKLEDLTREKLNQIFNCPVTSRYSNQENGVLAHECIDSEEFHLNVASYFIEILKFDSDEPAQNGEEGRIIITDLYNYAQPFIRYDTGDVGVVENKGKCRLDTPILKQLSGRMLDFVYDTKGNLLSSHIISLTMRPFDKLKQYQFIQETKKGYILKVNGGNYKTEDYINSLLPLLGEDAQISIVQVDEIPVIASGKRKHTICLLNK